MTVDARALDGALMGTQVLVLELVRALADTGALRLRVLVGEERIDRDTLALLGDLPETEILAEAAVDGSTPRSDVFHRPQQAFSPGDVALACRLGERIVLSQLDLIAYSNPSYFPDESVFEDYKRAGRRGMAAAERVLVLSEHTRSELLQHDLVEAERIRVVPPGLDHHSRPPAGGAGEGRGGEGRGGEGGGGEGGAGEGGAGEGGDQGQGGEGGDRDHQNAVPARVRVNKPFFARAREGHPFLLCLGTDYAHKNRPFALELLVALRERHGWNGTLVLAGTHVEHGSSRELERKLLSAHPQLGEVVVDLGPIGDGEKEWLMDNAAAVVYPSRYEGFGMVPFEAGLLGVPCLFAACSSLGEGAVAQAATIVPWDAQASADAAHTLLSDREARARHVGALAGAARELTWQRAAQATVEAYREAAMAPVRVAATLTRDALARERQLEGTHRRDVEMLIDEREKVLATYNEMLAELGPARALIGEHGALPMDMQRALLALSARPAIGRPLFAAFTLLFRAARTVGRAIPCKNRDSRPEDPSPATRAGRPRGR